MTSGQGLTVMTGQGGRVKGAATYGGGAAGTTGQTNYDGGAVYPHALIPELMCFCGTQALARRYANAEPARCGCPVCDGRGLDRFNSPDGEARVESEDHNAYVWGAWVNEMSAQPVGGERKSWWRDRCALALGRYDLENARIEQPKGFEPPAPLRAWATLPIDGDHQTPPRESRTRSVQLLADLFEELPARGCESLADEWPRWH